MTISNLFTKALGIGIYDTSPKMVKLYREDGSTFDGLPEFVTDDLKERYLEQKLDNLEYSPTKYHASTFIEGDEQKALEVVGEIFSLLTRKMPHDFHLSDTRATCLSSNISLDLINGKVNQDKDSVGIYQRIFAYLSQCSTLNRIFDFLALHLQEDFAVTSRRENQPMPNDYLELAHICFPSHWDPSTKVGKNFSQIHQPVANNERLLKAHFSLVEAMLERGPFGRFVWGISKTLDLNCHPEYLATKIDQKLSGAFEDIVRTLNFRVERQVVFPLPKTRRSFFTIRIFAKTICELAKDPEQRILLRSGLMSMNDEALRYKGLVELRDPLVEYLS